MFYSFSLKFQTMMVPHPLACGLASMRSPKTVFSSHVPSPIIIVVAAAKRSQSVSLQGISSPIQGLLSGFQARHNHRKRSAHANFFRCRTPKPPFFFDLAVLIQLTLHFPPVNLSVPAQRNCLCLLSISSNVAFGGFSADKK